MVHAGDPAYPIHHFSEAFLLSANGAVLPLERIERIENFGHSMSGAVFLYRPTRAEQIAELFELARERDVRIGLRGAGRSYGDAALNTGEMVLDLQGMKRVLAWDVETGVIKIEPGVTIQQLWQQVLPDGWWIPVVPGTMLPTLGGCLASNIHGKNNWEAGPLGEHVLNFEALLPNGKLVECSPTKNKVMFYAMIGGMGMLGVFTSITLQMKRIYSGMLDVYAWAEPSLAHSLASLDEHKGNDYIVGWVDCTHTGRGLGRGQLHRANYLAQEEDDQTSRSLLSENQILPDKILGLMPKSAVWRLMQPVINNAGVRMGNMGKYWLNRTIGNRKRYSQSLVAFNFLLDYVPNWERAYGPGGMIQYQSFLPKERAAELYIEMLKLCHQRRLPAYLGVIKRHRADGFLLTHGIDGFSLALDFRVTKRNRKRLQELIRDLNRLVINASGRFYFAKDSTLNTDEVRQYLGDETVEKFRALKAKSDPHNLLQTNLYARCFLNGSR